MESNFPTKKVLLAVFAVVLLFLSFAAFEIVGPGERGVKIRLGAVQDVVLDEGIHFKIPFVERIEIIDVSVQKVQEDVDAASKDLQTVNVVFALNYHVNPVTAPDVYQEFRQDFEEVLIQPTLQEAVKATTAQFTAEELITQRAAVNEQVNALITAKLSVFGFIIDGVSIVNFSFSDSFNDAIEAKVTAEQNALKAENELAQAEFEAQKIIVEAQAEAEAIKIQIESLQVQGGESYVQLQAVQKWDGVLPMYTGDSLPLISLPAAQ